MKSYYLKLKKEIISDAKNSTTKQLKLKKITDTKEKKVAKLKVEKMGQS